MTQTIQYRFKKEEWKHSGERLTGPEQDQKPIEQIPNPVASSLVCVHLFPRTFK